MVFGSEDQIKRRSVVDSHDQGCPCPGHFECNNLVPFEEHPGLADWDETKMGCMGWPTYEACLRHAWGQQPAAPPPSPARFEVQAKEEGDD